jgi:hypothetical protein
MAIRIIDFAIGYQTDQLPSSAIDADTIAVVPSGNLSSDNVQDALVEHQGDIDSINSTVATHTASISSLQTAVGVNTAAIATKADASTTTAALATKADASATTTALGTKLDKTSGVASQLRIDDFLEIDEETDPATPAAGKIRVYGKSDKKLYLVDSTGLVKQVGGGGLSPLAVSSAVSLAVINTMYAATSSGGFSITLPTIPASGGSIGVMDAGETCSPTNYIRVTPASGQSIDGYPANDSLDLDYVRANIILYAAPGATSWKVQYQATNIFTPGSQPGYGAGSAIGAGNIGQVLTASLSNTSVPVSATATTVGSLVLTAGVWMVYAVMAVGAAGTTTSYADGSISTTAATHRTGGLARNFYSSGTAIFTVPPLYINTTGQTIYLISDMAGTGTAPTTNASVMEFYAVRIA